MNPHPGNDSNRLNQPSGGGNPTPLDAAFIMFASLCLLMAFLWIGGKQSFRDIPPSISNFISGFWSKVVVGSGTVGTLALRKWLYQKTGPNYLLWIPACTVVWIVLYLTLLRIPNAAPEPDTIPAIAHLTLEPRTPAWTTDQIQFVSISPHLGDTALLDPLSQEENGYRKEVEIPNSNKIEFVAEINHNVVVSHSSERSTSSEYLLCLQNPPSHRLKSIDAGKPSDVWISCNNKGRCSSAAGRVNQITTCEEQAESGSGLRVVNAAEDREVIREPGWVVPSLTTLEQMTKSRRQGYTRFDVSLLPSKLLESADRFYYGLKVNGVPIYIDGFLPDRHTYPLIHQGENNISFALENLAFRGRNNGYEAISIDIIFLSKEGHVQSKLSFSRSYIALRDAPAIQITDALATATWSGKYEGTMDKNRYNIVLESSPNLERINQDGRAIDSVLAHNGSTFIGTTVPLKGPVVTLIRPPRFTSSYGLGLGVVLPTQQVQLTFSRDEAKEFCHWVAGNVRTIPHMKPMLYDSASKNGPPCE